MNWIKSKNGNDICIAEGYRCTIFVVLAGLPKPRSSAANFTPGYQWFVNCNGNMSCCCDDSLVECL